MRRGRSLALIVGTLLLAWSNPSSAVLIDTFDSGTPFVLENVGSDASLSQSASVLGGTRTVTAITRAEFDPSLGALDVLFTGIASRAGVNLEYHPDGADLTLGGADRFRITFESDAPLNQFPRIDVLIVVNNGATVTSGSVQSAEPLDRFFVFMDPALIAVTNVTALLVEVRADLGSGERMRITDFRTVPEASTLLAIGTGLAWLSWHRRLAGDR